jgi:hypothetical protein
MIEVVTKFACYCGFHSEGKNEPTNCTRCGDKMHSWGTREVTTKSFILVGESADKRSINGGY